MGKLKLNLDQLAVESFDTAISRAKRGTVMAEEQCTCPSACQTACTCPGCDTCDWSECNQQSCDGSCAGSTCDFYTQCYPCGSNGAYTCDPTITGGGGICDCCPV